MLSILRSLDTTRYTPRTYVVSSGDQFSATKAKQFEETLKQTQAHGAHNGHTKSLSTEVRQDYEIVTVGRAREIHQPLYTTPVTALQCLWSCILLLIRNNATPPDIIVTNGPATGVMVVLASLIVRFFGMNRGAEMRSIYVESWARVKTLSLSGKILLWAGLTDRFLVQWEGLKKGRAEWKGFLVE
jgi:beta-1,4-N-acetylglucosaminyltransferase